MKKINRGELASLIKEVLQERWTDILWDPEARSDRPEQKAHDLYFDSDIWAEEMLDDENRYIGPKLRGFKFKRGQQLFPKKEDWEKTELDERREKSIAYAAALDWNEAYGKEHGMTERKIETWNQSLKIRYKEKYEVFY